MKYVGKIIVGITVMFAALLYWLGSTRVVETSVIRKRKNRPKAALPESRSNSMILVYHRIASIAEREMVSSGRVYNFLSGPAGNCTPEILGDKRDLELLRAQ